MRGHEKRDINVQAMERMSELNQQLVQYGYTEREREELLVRLLLCFFADGTGVFPAGALFDYLQKGDKDGSDLAKRMQTLFRVLGGAELSDIPEELVHFPVLGRSLFAEKLPVREMDVFFLMMLHSCREIDWQNLSPAVFGALFQEVMNQQDRREWGAYYTSEENIERVIDPLFMNGLRQEREACRGNRRRLAAFQQKLSKLRFLDPACGCGNFLILTYRRLRELELDVIEELYDTSQRVLDVSMYCQVSISQFYGIESEPFQARIARICLWIIERQMNQLAAERFGITQYCGPLIRPVAIHEGNALTMDWSDLISSEKLDYIIGNPPFVGARLMNASQKQDMKIVFRGFHAVGSMDYVTAWYRKAAEYMMGTGIRAAFVSTNSICQGEQAALLWQELKNGFNMSIDFAWRTFVWNNGVRGQARVHCVIVGFSDALSSRRGDQHQPLCYIYEGGTCHPVAHINAYLTSGPDVAVRNRRRPISDVPPMVFGSMANDGGNLILSKEERENLLSRYLVLYPFIRPFLGAEEFINGRERYCLWLAEGDIAPILEIPEVAERLRKVREFRSGSRREVTRALAMSPECFGEIRQPWSGSYILVPRVSSVRRKYIPMGFVPSDWVASDAALIIPDADEALFALLCSSLHMLWVQTVSGRLKSDYRYSASVVYNNFPFPEITPEQREALAQTGRRILGVRSQFAGASLASLYDPEKMPAELAEAHRQNDALVEEIYGCAGCDEESQLSMLFARFQELTGEKE